MVLKVVVSQSVQRQWRLTAHATRKVYCAFLCRLSVGKSPAQNSWSLKTHPFLLYSLHTLKTADASLLRFLTRSGASRSLSGGYSCSTRIFSYCIILLISPHIAKGMQHEFSYVHWLWNERPLNPSLKSDNSFLLNFIAWYIYLPSSPWPFFLFILIRKIQQKFIA